MSSYGRAYDAAVAILEAYGIDPQMTTPKIYDRHDDGTTTEITLADALCDAVYDTAFNMGERVAVGRMTAAIKRIGMGEDVTP